MRKRIQDFAYARFQYENPVPQFSTDRLEFEVLQEEVYRGSFSFTSQNGITMCGVAVSSNPRMKCLTTEFEGTEVEILFEFHSEGLVEGDVQKGEFHIALNGGEYSLFFAVSVVRFYPVSSIGKIKNLFDFANLAQVSYEEAYRIFTAPFFKHIWKETEEREALLYRGLGGEQATMQGLEEFLVGVRKKQRIRIALDEEEQHYSNVTEDKKEVVRVRKNQWGYLRISVTSDSEAIEPVKRWITSMDFVGNYAEVEFIIHSEKLHTGNNYGRLLFQNINQQEICRLCIHMDGKNCDSNIQERKKLQKQLTRLYLDFRMRRIVAGVWSKESCSCLERLKELEPDNLWYVLYHAQALLVNKQRQEADWLLDAFCSKEISKDSPLYAYYLYLCTLQERESSYITKIFRKIQKIYQKNQEDMRLFFIMLFLDPQLNQSKSRKLSAIEEKVEQGMYSPILYMEAYYLICHDVYLLQKMGTFERRVLYWAAKEHVLTPELTMRAVRLMAQLRKYHPMWYRILEGCYQVKQEPEVLQALCSFCIKWNLMGQKYFVWYDKGIREKLRIAGLYEAWIQCAGQKQLEQFPKTVMIYFQYQNNLADKKKAQLYASIVRNKEKQKNLYATYQKQIQQFVVEMIQKKQIDENLALLYQEEWKELVIRKELAGALAKLLYVHSLTCQDEHAMRIIVVHRELKQEQAVALYQNKACLQIYSGSYCMLAEDENGMRYVPEDSWELKRLMQPGRYIRQCVEAAPEELPHLIHYFDGRKIYHTFQEKDMPALLYLLESEQISSDYKNEMKQQVIRYYYHSFTGDDLDRYLKQVEYTGLKRDIRNQLLELMISRGLYDRAYEMLQKYGSEQATISKLLIVAGEKIASCMFEEDLALLDLCRSIFGRGKYNENVLRYLCRYFRGNVKEMEQLWTAAREFEIDTYELEERLLVQVLYTEGYTSQIERIFESYFSANGNEMVLMAYLSYFSYQYFVNEVLMEDGFFRCLEQQILLENPLNDSCRLAYFRWLAKQQEYTENQEKLLEDLLREYLGCGMIFAFYQNLPQKLLQKYYLHDRVILEYRTNPSHRVLIDYCYTNPLLEDDYIEEDMEQVYEGIFVKQFVVFFGEEIPYYIKEETPNRQEITESGHIKTCDSMLQEEENCYELLNGMMISYHLRDERTLRQLYGQYRKREMQVEEEFCLL